MAGEALLIAAFSGRALAQSARRAGYVPLVADAFGDSDTHEAAHAARAIDGAVESGFRTKPVMAALDALASSAPSAAVGLVLGSGFEDKPRLIQALAERYRLIGVSAAVTKALKDPDVFFPALDELGVAHPLTTTIAPENGSGWISKRVGGSGGRHIRIVVGPARAWPRRYFQHRMDGERYSIGALFTAAGDARLWTTRQWIAPSGRQPFRYGGAVSSPVIAGEIENAMADSARRVGKRFGLRGMVSFDFIVAGGVPHLLEVNARPGAALDVLDDEAGTQIKGHVDAFADTPSGPLTAPARQHVRAAAILHADRGSLVLGEMPWPQWSADRGAPGTAVPAGAPLATAIGEAPTAQQAESLARARLAELADLIYGHATRR